MSKEQIEFVKKVYPAAARLAEAGGVNPLFVTAQAALETGWKIRGIGNNIFGITKGSWTGPVSLELTTEYFKTPTVTFKAPERVVSVDQVAPDRYKYRVYRLFRVYPTVDACLDDHLALLKKPMYADAWPYRNDAKEYARRLVDNTGLGDRHRGKHRKITLTMRKVYYNSLAARLLLWRKGYETAMIFGFICTKRKRAQPLSSKSVNHEAIHVEQYMEVTATAMVVAFVLSLAFGWAVWPFIVALMLYYVIYFVEAGISWVFNAVRRKLSATAAADAAYYASMFEMEAHANEGDNQYICGRRSFNWIRYFGRV